MSLAQYRQMLKTVVKNRKYEPVSHWALYMKVYSVMVFCKNCARVQLKLDLT